MALTRVNDFRSRDAIEVAHSEVVHCAAMAYYYAGLAFALTALDCGRDEIAVRRM